MNEANFTSVTISEVKEANLDIFKTILQGLFYIPFQYLQIF